MESFNLWMEKFAFWLGQWGVPEQYRLLLALGVLFLGVTLAAIVLVVLLLRLTRPRTKVAEPPAPEPEASGGEKGEGPVVAAEEPPSEPEGSLEGQIEAGPSAELRVSRGVPLEKASSLFERMRRGLAKTQVSLVGRIDDLLGGGAKVDADLLEELEEILITADFGMQTTQALMQKIEQRLARSDARDPKLVRQVLQEEIAASLGGRTAELTLPPSGPQVIMVVGVNGVGKTTTIGKLAKKFLAQGKRVVLGAGDTFRAAAAEQLAIWGERSGADVIRHAEGADPAAVAFDAAKAAVARKADVLILDTAGRLHTKVNLMEELKKIRRVLAREIPEAPHETLLVLDATTGQNALAQARLFKEAVEVSGIVLTKLDGTARGGIIVAISADLGLPVKFVGIGEQVDDLRPFDPQVFVEALFAKSEES